MNNKKVFKGKFLIAWQKQYCKDIKIAIFGFVLQKLQIDAIYIFFGLD